MSSQIVTTFKNIAKDLSENRDIADNVMVYDTGLPLIAALLTIAITIESNCGQSR